VCVHACMCILSHFVKNMCLQVCIQYIFIDNSAWNCQSDCEVSLLALNVAVCVCVCACVCK
jgi:hypothetical protein